MKRIILSSVVTVGLTIGFNGCFQNSEIIGTYSCTGEGIKKLKISGSTWDSSKDGFYWLSEIAEGVTKGNAEYTIVKDESTNSYSLNYSMFRGSVAGTTYILTKQSENSIKIVKAKKQGDAGKTSICTKE